MICQNGWEISLKIWWKEKLQPQAVKELVLRSRTILNLYQESVHGNTMYLRISQKIEISKYAKGAKLQGLLGQSAPAVTYTAQKILVA